MYISTSSHKPGQTPSNLQKQKGGERTLSKRVKAIEEEEEEEAGTPIVYDTSEKDGRYVPIRTNPEEEDTLQLHTDSEITGEKLKTQIRRTNREQKTE